MHVLLHQHDGDALVDRHPEAGLALKVRTPERAKLYQWMTFPTNWLQEELMVWQYPDRLTGTHARGAAQLDHKIKSRNGLCAFTDRVSQARQESSAIASMLRVDARELCGVP